MVSELKNDVESKKYMIYNNIIFVFLNKLQNRYQDRPIVNLMLKLELIQV